MNRWGVCYEEEIKKYVATLAKVDRTKFYSIEESIKLVKDACFAKFDETIDLRFVWELIKAC